MAITPRSRGLGNIGAIVDRQGRASPTRPVAKAPPRPVAKAAPKFAPETKPAVKPAARVAPKPAPKMAPKPNPFLPKVGNESIRNVGVKPDTRAPGGGGMNMEGNPIGGGMGAQMNFAGPNLARNTGPIAGAAPRPSDLYNRGGFGLGEPQVIELQPPPPINSYMDPNLMVPDYGGPFTPRPDMGPGVGFGVGLPQPYDIPQTAPDFSVNQSLPDFSNPGMTPVIEDMRLRYLEGEDPGDPRNQPPASQPGPGMFGQMMPTMKNSIGGLFGGLFGNKFGPELQTAVDQGVDYFGKQIGMPNYGGGQQYNDGLPPGAEYMPFGGEPAPYNAGMQSPSRVINQVGKPGFQPRPNMSNAFNPYDNNDYGDGFMGGGSGSLFGGGGFAGK